MKHMKPYCNRITTGYRGVLSLSGALAILGSNFAIAASVSSPGDIGKSWPDRRPMGRLIFADEAHITSTNLNGWTNGGPTAFGVAAFQQNILSQVNNGISNVIKMHGQGILVWDITGCGKTTWLLSDEEYLGDARFLYPKGSGLTVKTAYGPYVPPTSALGLNGIERTMDAIADQIFASIRSAGLTCGVALRAEKVYVNSKGQLDGSQGQFGEAQPYYDTVSHQLADLDAKLTYAYKRWGCRIFYVDSNVASSDVIYAQQVQGNPTYAPAWVYTQLNLLHPNCLIIPEETYSNPFTFQNPVINDPPYRYDRVSCRYTQLSNQWQYPFVWFNEVANVPDVFTLIVASDVGASDPSDTPSVVKALQANQCILMANVWYDDPGIMLINDWQTKAGVNGF